VNQAMANQHSIDNLQHTFLHTLLANLLPGRTKHLFSDCVHIANVLEFAKEFDFLLVIVDDLGCAHIAVEHVIAQVADAGIIGWTLDWGDGVGVGGVEVSASGSRWWHVLAWWTSWHGLTG
jgi:hypothetical protein